MPSINHRNKIAVIGTGASALYLLKNLLESLDTLSSTIDEIVLFERGSRAGMGMPYHPATTDCFNLCNISSEEVPYLQQPLADWLRLRPEESLSRFNMKRETITDTDTYPRLAVGEYFEAQFHEIVDTLRAHGVRIRVKLNTPVTDLRDNPTTNTVHLSYGSSTETFDRVVIATGHAFNDGDQPEQGYYASPWPIQKYLPAEGKPLNIVVGTLGASLSAFDVVTSIAHRQGRFESQGDTLRFIPHKGVEKFRIVMHAANGWLPHLQYNQCRPFREVYRYISRLDLLAMRDTKGQLHLTDFFDQVCRLVLSNAFAEDGRSDLATQLLDKNFSLEQFVDQMSAEHTYDNPFEGMKREFSEAKKKVANSQPVRWKESLDDLMYTLSYHADLLPAEDHLRLKNHVLPFLNSVIAAMPLTSAAVLLALYDAGVIDLVAGRAEVTATRDKQTTITVTHDDDSTTTHTYGLFVDCTGQSGLDLKTYPFQTLVAEKSVRAATAPFTNPAQHNGERHLDLPGITIDAAYRIVGDDNQPNPRIYDIAFPHIAGLRPYSYGLQACNHTAGVVIEAWKLESTTGSPPPSKTETLTRLHDVVANEA